MRILIIDDDKEICEFLKGNLESEGFFVETAINGEDGSFMARAQNYDLVILDNIMPRKNGMEVCQDIRKSGNKTPILMLSVMTETDDKVNLLNAGADDYLIKPFSYRELQSRIRAILRRPKELSNPLLKIDDLIIDTDKQKVLRGSREIYLTRKEFALAEYLARNSGRVISRGMLMENVWNAKIDPFSNTIESHILNLRKKIDSIKNKRKLIHTIPGRGYKIESVGKAVFD